MIPHSVAIIGAGRSGLAAARLLHRQGAKVLLSDSGTFRGPIPKGVEIESGGHSSKVLNVDALIVSPGVPLHLPLFHQAARKKIPIWGELEYASRWIRPRQTIAITGTNGKTTTTTLVGELFKASGQSTIVGGNIGTPLSTLIPRIDRWTTLVLEVSSYQLEAIDTFHPTLSAILNITPDHLEHHGSMRAYVNAKARIFENQTSREVCVLNADDTGCRRLAKQCSARIFYFSRRKRLAQGVWMDGQDVVVHWGKFKERFPLQWTLPGAHNVENALASIALALCGGVSVEAIRKVLKRFHGVEHRLERVRVLNDVVYINDSKATNVDSTRVALAAFDRPLWVIMGGEGKGSPYDPLKALVQSHVKGLLLIGEEAPQIARELGSSTRIESCGTMAKAVARGRTLAKPGDVVLLSPACASFDQYKNYEERGRDFKQCVRKLR